MTTLQVEMLPKQIDLVHARELERQINELRDVAQAAIKEATKLVRIVDEIERRVAALERRLPDERIP